MPPQEEPASLLPAVARVYVNKHLKGTAFYVGQRLVMTCAHVISSAHEPPDTKVTVQFHGSETRIGAALKSEFWRSQDAEDVAVLQLDHAPANVSALHLASSKNRDGHECRTFGYPEGHEEGLHGSAIVTGKLEEQGVIQIKSTEVTVGFSGAPFYDTKAHAVIGMVNAISKKDRHHRLDDVAFVTPAETLRDVCDRMVFRSRETEDDLKRSIARLKAGATSAIRNSAPTIAFFVEQLPELPKLEHDELPAAIVDRLFEIEMSRVLNMLIEGCAQLGGTVGPSGVSAASCIIRLAGYIVPWAFSPAELQMVRTAIDNCLPLIVVPAKKDTIVEIIMAGVDGREARINPKSIPANRPPQIPRPPEPGLSAHKFKEEFEKGVLQALRIASAYQENPVDRINQALELLRDGSRPVRYYYIVADTDSDAVVQDLKARFPELVFVKRPKPADESREFALDFLLLRMFEMEEDAS